MDLSMLLYLIAVIIFGIATVVGSTVSGKFNLIALGLAFFAAGHLA